MKSFTQIASPYCRAGLVLALTLIVPTLFAQSSNMPAANAADQATAKSADNNTDSAEMAKAALADIDARLDRLEKLADAAPTPEQKTDARTRQAELKKRRDELKENFDPARSESLKTDLQTEIDRITALARESELPQSKPVANATLPSSTTTVADGNAEYPATTDADQAGNSATLPRLDTDRDVLAAKIADLADPLHKNGLTRGLRGAQHDTLVADLGSD